MKIHNKKDKSHDKILGYITSPCKLERIDQLIEQYENLSDAVIDKIYRDKSHDKNKSIDNYVK